MNLENYETESVRLSKAIDIAITAFEKFPPKGYTNDNLKHVLGVYNGWKNDCLNPEPKYHKLASLKYIIENTFTFFQEGSGEAVEYFWMEIKNQRLEYERINKLEKILKTGKIKNIHEYDFIIDVLIPYLQEGLLNDKELIEINKMIIDFEIKVKKYSLSHNYFFGLNSL